MRKYDCAILRRHFTLEQLLENADDYILKKKKKKDSRALQWFDRFTIVTFSSTYLYWQ